MSMSFEKRGGAPPNIEALAKRRIDPGRQAAETPIMQLHNSYDDVRALGRTINCVTRRFALYSGRYRT